ncbi:MAG: M28 family peptidase [Bacteroidota bacterium]
MKKTIYMIGLAVAVSVIAQDKTAKKLAKTITAADLKEHLLILASNEYEGRETGKKGQKMAAKYIAKHFEQLGFEAPVDGSYYQTFNLQESQIGNVYFRKGKDKKAGFKDFIYYSRSETIGEEYIRIVIAAEDDANIKSYNKAYVTFISNRFEGVQERVENASKAGAEGFIVVIKDDSEYNSFQSRIGNYMKRPSLALDENSRLVNKMVIIGKEMLSWLFDKPFEEINAGDESVVIFNADYLRKPIETENVLGYLKGTEKPEELLVITSHYDHIGIINGEINNGADDDGSGTVSVLEIAEAFAKAAKTGNGPKRSVLFMTVTGEEKGLLGSRYYTDTDPIFPIENTVANLNIDMVGRIDDTHKSNPNYVYLIGSDKLSQDLHELSEQVNENYVNLELDYTYNDENDPNRFYYRSDHYNFAKNNVPIIFYFNGTHEDYHKPSDTVNKIDFDTMEKRARLIFHTGWEIVNRDERIAIDKMEAKIE